MNKTQELKNQQDFLRRNKSSKEMLQKQQRILKRGLLGTTKKSKVLFLEQQQEVLKKPKEKDMVVFNLH